MTSKKAERIYKWTASSIRRYIRWFENGELNLRGTDITDLIVALEYEDDESISMRTLNDMMKILESKERNPYRIETDTELTMMRNAINYRIKDIKDFRAFLKTL